MARRRIGKDRETREALNRMKFEAADETGARSGQRREAPPNVSANGEMVRRMVLEQLRQLQDDRPGSRP